jgi:hypothetical protein
MSGMAVQDPMEALVARWSAARPFVVVGSVSIVAGGVIAAVARPSGFEMGSWLAAYLVLVGGVAQIALGGGQAWLAGARPRPGEIRAEVVAWNVGVVATIVGSLVALPVLTTLGGIATAVALVLFLAGVRVVGPAPAVARACYRGIAAIVLLSIPVGLVLAWVRHG